MATVKLDLVKDIWQEIGSTGVLFSKGTSVSLELVNADALPTGDVPEAMPLGQSELQVLPAPADGSYFVRTTNVDGGVFKYNEI
jgi:hypothetical protein